MIRTIKINIPTIEEILDLRYPIKRFFSHKLVELDTWAFRTFGTAFWKLMYRATGRCGSILQGHVPVFNNPKYWLWDRSGKYPTCTICGEVVKVRSSHGSYKNYARSSRETDMAELRRLRTTATNDAERLSIDKAMYNINHEEKHVRDMREELIKVTRDQDHKEIKEIHEFVGDHKKYRESEWKK